MVVSTNSSAFSDALVILGAAGLAIPAFTRFRITPVIGFIIFGALVGPNSLGKLVADVPWLYYVTISNPHAIEPFAEFGIILLLFSIGLELSFRRLWGMRKAVFGLGSSKLLLCALAIGSGLFIMGEHSTGALGLGLAVALSSTALALGVFLISVGMSLDPVMILANWQKLALAVAGVVLIKSLITGILLRFWGAKRAVAMETGLLMSAPSETTLIVLGVAAQARLIAADTALFWQVVTAIGLTITPILAKIGHSAARRLEKSEQTGDTATSEVPQGRAIIAGFGRVGRLVAQMLDAHNLPYLAVDANIDTVANARRRGYKVMFGDISRPGMIEHLDLGKATALILTMDDPVQVVRLARRASEAYPNLPIVARARDPNHAAELYRAGATDAVPETLESSLQLSEAVLVDLGVAMGPVIASIHEKRAELRAKIMEMGQLDKEPPLRGRRLRDAG